MIQPSSLLTSPHQSTKRRLRLALSVVALGLLAAFAIAPKLFLHQPLLGPIPVASWIRLPPAPVDLVILLVVGGLLAPVFWLRNPRRLILIWCMLFFLRCVWDRITWQPYLLQYFFMMFSFALVDWENEQTDSERQAAVLNTNRLILVGVYFWSGLSKLNYASMVTGPRQLLQPLEETGLVPALSVLWMVAPVVEIGLALGLLTRRFRKLSVAVGVTLHTMILVIYGPFGFDHNAVVWPWNVVMILLLVILFGNDRQTEAKSIAWVARFSLHRLVLIVFGLCPMLSYVGWWSPYLSFRMYSHHYQHAALLLRQAAIDQLPPAISEHVKPSQLEGWDGILHVTYWGESQLNAFPPSDLAVSQHLARRICRLVKEPDGVIFVLVHPPNVFTGKTKQEVIPCHQLTVPKQRE